MSTLATPEAKTETAERTPLLSRVSFSIALVALVVALLYIATIIFLQVTHLVPPQWVATFLRVVPLADILLSALGLLLNLVETYHIVTRREDFNPKEAGREYAADDLAAILARVRPGCAMRLTFPTAVVLGMIALVLSLVPLQGTDALQVHARDTLRSCASGTALKPFTFEMDNSASTVSVSWSATPVEQLTPGTPWAQVQPSGGALAAGQRRDVQVIPNALICQYALAPQRAGHAFAAAPLEAIYHIQVAIHVRRRDGIRRDADPHADSDRDANPHTSACSTCRDPYADADPRANSGRDRDANGDRDTDPHAYHHLAREQQPGPFDIAHHVYGDRVRHHWPSAAGLRHQLERRHGWLSGHRQSAAGLSLGQRLRSPHRPPCHCQRDRQRRTHPLGQRHRRHLHRCRLLDHHHLASEQQWC